SNLGFWQRQNAENRTEIVVFDRESGDPLKGVKAEFWTENYNQIFRKNQLVKAGKGVSDADGFLMPDVEVSNSFRVLLSKGADTLFLDDRFYNYGRGNDPKPYRTVHFFLDRAIYRPGQTIYFKGILVEKSPDGLPKIVPNQPVKVTFRNANYQEVESQTLTTNEFGTINGTFIAPKSGLTGAMSILASVDQNQSSHIGFRVEEYKRPKFQVRFEPVAGSFKLDSEMSVTGKAEAYAGNVISDARVQWRVVRETRFPWLPWWRYGGFFPRNGSTMEIANGFTQTGADGRFEIAFLAKSDPTISKDQKPEFRYTVYADVVDMTGETHSASTNVRVGTVALDLRVEVPELAEISDLDSLVITSKNLNGTFEPVTGSLTIEKLSAPDRIFLERYWEKPDKPVIPKADFERDFPQFAYQNEDKPEYWPVEKIVHAIDFDTEKSPVIDLRDVAFSGGKYLLTIQTRDAFGTPVETKKIFTLYDAKSSKPAVSTLEWHILNKKSAEPGETFELAVNSSLKCLPVLFEVERKGKITTRKWLNVKSLHREIIRVTEADRGGFALHLSYANQNRVFAFWEDLRVPWSNKELVIEYETFRDKLLPGQEEEWVLKIKGPKGEQVAAEMVTSLYDASLDAFVANNWALDLYPVFFPRRPINIRGFGLTDGRMYGGGYVSLPNAARYYPTLNW
ncbi:MAG: alpha-2-macroglobulin, partial [Bacteroidetes bacterium]